MLTEAEWNGMKRKTAKRSTSFIRWFFKWFQMENDNQNLDQVNSEIIMD